MNLINMVSIGKVTSSISDKVYENWGNVISEINIDPAYLDGLVGLEEFSHAIVVFYMDDFREETIKGWKRKPRGIEDLDEKGCFAQRSKYRPNPFGISTVEILSINDHKVIVKGLDANNGTLVLDIKPYIPEFDRRENVQTPNWMKELMKDYF